VQRRKTETGKQKKLAYYNRILIYPFVILIFIIVTNQLKKYTTNVSHTSHYQYLSIKPISEKQEDYDVVFYNINLKVELDSSLQSGNLQGIVGITFRAKDKPVNGVRLNFSTQIKVDSVEMASGFSHKNNILQVKLRESVDAGETSRIIIHYHGWPKPYHEWVYGWKLVTRGDDHKTPWVSTMNPPFGAQTWLPCKDDPGDKADSVLFRINVPESLMVVCNGSPVNTTPLGTGRKIVSWKESFPIATYLLAVHIGMFQRFESSYRQPNGISVPLQIYAIDVDTGLVHLVFQQLSAMFDFLTSTLGPYPFAPEKYAMIVFPNRGGMENQTISSVEDINASSTELYVHELIHQWLGDCITPAGFEDSWISEGLATYFTALYEKTAQGQTGFKYFMNRRRFVGKGQIRVQAVNIPDSVYHVGRVYNKASWFFYMLHNLVGDSLFFTGVRSCLDTYQYGNISGNVLRKVFEQISGKNLSRFFDQWLHEKYVPRLEGKLKLVKAESGQYEYEFALKQLQKSKKPYHLPLEIFCWNPGADSTITFEMTERKQKLRIRLPFDIRKINIDPDEKILMSKEIYF